MFPDVPPAFDALARRGIDDRHLLVGERARAAAAVRRHRDGDLTPFITGFFDTGVGAKTVGPTAIAGSRSS